MERIIDKHAIEDLYDDLNVGGKSCSNKLKLLKKHYDLSRLSMTFQESQQIEKFRMNGFIHTYKLLDNPKYVHLKHISEVMQDTDNQFTLEGAKS